MKRFLTIIACAALSVAVVSAQDDFKGWFIQAQGGVGHTVGETSFTDLLSPAAALSLGYQFSPVFAARANVNGWQAKGNVLGPVNVYKYNFVEGGVDLLADLCNLLGENRSDRTLNPYLLAGLGANYAFGNDEANKLADKFPADNYLWDGSKISPLGKAGAGVNIRLTDAVALNLEANSSFLSDHFNSKVGSKVDYQIVGLAGLTIRFGKGKNVAAPVAAATTPAAAAAAAKPAAPTKPEPAEETKPAPKPVVEEDVVAPEVFKGLTENIYFDLNKTVIRASEQPKIDQIVSVMKANPGVKVDIKAHADKDTGNAKINKRLSQGRAAAVKKALVAAGIAADRINTADFGDTANPYNTPETNRVAICVVE